MLAQVIAKRMDYSIQLGYGKRMLDSDKLFAPGAGQ
jgi:hypothetical protein